MGRTERDSNMELLRIVSMLLIVFSHSCTHGPGYALGHFGDMMGVCGTTGVNCFVLISGYYMVTSRITLAKMLKLWVTVWMYSAGIYLLMKGAAAFDAANIKEALLAFLPLVCSKYWFVSVYVALMLLTPFLNQYLRSLTRAQLLRFLAVLFVLLVVVPARWLWWGGELIWFIFLYGIAACIRLHGSRSRTIPPYKCFAATGLLSLCLVGMVMLMNLPDNALSPLIERVCLKLGSAKGSLFSLLLALSLMLGFANSRLGYRKWINSASACALAVYLIHDHSSFRQYLWFELLQGKQVLSSPWLLPYCVGVSLLIYVVCTMIEWLRQATLGRLYDACAQRWLLPMACAVWGRGRRMVEKCLGIAEQGS